MASANVSTIVKERPLNKDFQMGMKQRCYVLDVTDSGYTGIAAADTHNLIPIPEGEALVGGVMIVETSFTSAGAATVTLQVASDALSGDIPKANLAAGDVVRLNFAVSAATETKATYAKSAADTLDWVVGTAALTAGKAIFLLDFVDAETLLDQGKIKW